MRLIASFGFPILLGVLFQQFYSLADTAIVGKILGGGALAAVGSTASINFLVVGFSVGICSGFAIPVAQQFGAGNYYELRRYVTGSAWLCAIFGVILTALTVLLCGDILALIHTPSDIFHRPTPTSSRSSPGCPPICCTTTPPASSALWGTAARRWYGSSPPPW